MLFVDIVAKVAYNEPITIGKKTNAKDSKLWYLLSNKRKKAIAEEHIIRVLTETKMNESEYSLDNSHLKVKKNMTNKIN